MTDRPPRDTGTCPSRRRFLGILTTASASAVAGCASSRGSTVRAPADFPEDAATVWLPVRPTAMDLGPGPDTPPLQPVVGALFHAPVLPVTETTGEPLSSGHTWTLDDEDVSVPCLVEEYEVTSEGRVRLVFDDRVTYWNGDAVTARGYYLRDRIQWIATQGSDHAPFTGNLVSETEYVRPAHDGVFNRFEASWKLHPGRPPLPASVLEGALERLESAGTDEQVVTEFGTYVGGMADLERFAEEGYGTGPYEIRSPDDVVQETRSDGATAANVETVYTYRRDDYPVSVPIPGLAVFGPASPATTVGGFIGNGTLDAGSDVVAPDGDYTTEFVGDGIEQVATYPSPVRRDVTLLFNWANPHLGRLWVRRAIAAALPLDDVVASVDGSSMRPPDRFSGLATPTDGELFGPEFRDSLVDYPVGADRGTASEWLREAGYERPDAQWVGPDGRPVEFELVVHGPRDERLARALVPSLESFGVPVRTVSVRDRAYHERMLGTEFDLAISHNQGGWGTTSFYGDWFEAGDGYVSTSVLTAVGDPPSACREDPVAATPETVTLPADPGLRIDGVDYPDGGTTYRHEAGEDHDICAATDRLRRTGVAEDVYREAARVCARWYNYALPTVLFAQDRVGLWVDTDEFVAPAADHPSTAVTLHAPRPKFAPTTPLDPHFYHLLAGTFRPG